MAKPANRNITQEEALKKIDKEFKHRDTTNLEHTRIIMTIPVTTGTTGTIQTV